MSCSVLVRDDVARQRGLLAPGDTPGGLAPADLQSAYDLPSSSAGSGRTVAIVDAYDDPNAEADLQLYRAQYGLPTCGSADGCFRKVDQRGGTSYPAPDPGWAQEISLDLDMVSAACPQCRLLLVEADDNSTQSLGAAVDEAVALGAKYVSNSYGGPEDPAETSWDDAYYHHPGVVVTASSGDKGYGVQYPASSPWVTAVGGTSLHPDSATARGWSETAWQGTGSGCSTIEATPWWQADGNCPGRSVADVSAVADPNTGVAAYDSYFAGGWGVVGGTSVAAPLIAAVYALAGDPVPDTDPASYPYLHAEDLNDVTSGSNGRCNPATWCTAGPGYDGPTGVGTPEGVTAFAMGPHGVLTGTVHDTEAHRALSGAQVQVGRAITTTGSEGTFQIAVPPGAYTVQVTKFGYGAASASVTLGDGQTLGMDVTLKQVPSTTVSGTVTDASGHGWPLYAKVRVLGTQVSTYTDPTTGRYQLRLPEKNSYRLAIDPVSAGYQEATRTVEVATKPVTTDVTTTVDALSCAAPGYAFTHTGNTQTFDQTSVPNEWTVSNAAGTSAGWEFDNPGSIGNQTGGSGGFAIAASGYPRNTPEDTVLQSPTVDLSNASSPVVEFDAEILATFGATSQVQVSTDGGASWTTVWQMTGTPLAGPDHEVVALPQAAGYSQVAVRFHYAGYGGDWEVDNVFLGDRPCDPTPGGLVTGTVDDANTGTGIDAATVSGNPDLTTITMPTPDDPALGNGFYELFSPNTGARPFTAQRGGYTARSQTINVAADHVVRADFGLAAGLLKVDPASLATTAQIGHSVHRTLTISNVGTAPATVDLSEETGEDIPGGPARGARTRLVSGSYSPLAPAQGADASTATAAPQPSDAAWTTLPNYPVFIMDNAVVTDTGTGTVYSLGGLNYRYAVGWLYAYSPTTQQWTPLASMADGREAPVAAMVGGKIYVAGGWNKLLPSGVVSPLEIYDPATNTWTTGPDIPHSYAGAGVAVLNGHIYVIGGCDPSNCGHTDVQVYDPATNTWNNAAAYPEPIAWQSCGAITGKIYCAGGTTDNTTSTTDAFVYSPRTDSWTRIASLPVDLWGSGSAAADGKLLVSGGVTNAGADITNQGFAYDPIADRWSPLPDAPVAVYRGGSSCGFYRIGGSTSGFGSTNTGVELPGYDKCGPVDVPWLSEDTTHVTLQPGQKITITVTFNAADPSITQPGTYGAVLDLGNDTPYQVPAIDASLTVR